ncbi:glycosyltransferase family 32 protein [Tatumella citrea]|uniref:Mannosyltransferase n=1 Tax=Tatumella citrea TaxID=53336 RepID=A0A1Y0L5Z4_TATCI|nr:capsular polysaccharide synthesis protein [Tatumella citrea]ARU93089.1 hypothetical protein A7K98_04305 [Tatumella citrea]ARU97127.1 hypothetical protein A7K99_04305 [Tatumella citrea]
MVIFKKILTFLSIIKELACPVTSIEKKTFSFSQNKTSVPSDIPRIIWLYWGSGRDDTLVDLCIKNIKTKCNKYQVNFLDENNYSSFIKKIDFPPNILAAHKSDLIRLNLLKKYGGIWVDATSFLFDDFDWVINSCSADDVFVCYSDDCTTDFNQPIVENWLIASPPGSHFIIEWLKEFEKSIFNDQGDSYYDDLIGSNIVQGLPELSYLRCYVACALVLSKRKYNLQMVNSGSTGHFLNYIFKSKSIFIAIAVCLSSSKSIYHPPVLKFTSGTRFWVRIFLEKKIYLKHSILGEVISGVDE